MELHDAGRKKKKVSMHPILPDQKITSAWKTMRLFVCLFLAFYNSEWNRFIVLIDMERVVCNHIIVVRYHGVRFFNFFILVLFVCFLFHLV